MNFLHNIPLFTIVMSFLTSVVCSIVSAKWAKRIYAAIGMIVIGLLIFCDYMLILSIQGKMSDGEFSRMVCKGSLPRYVKVMPGCIVSSLKTPALWK